MGVFVFGFPLALIKTFDGKIEVFGNRDFQACSYPNDIPQYLGIVDV